MLIMILENQKRLKFVVFNVKYEGVTEWTWRHAKMWRSRTNMTHARWRRIDSFLVTRVNSPCASDKAEINFRNIFETNSIQEANAS